MAGPQSQSNDEVESDEKSGGAPSLKALIQRGKIVAAPGAYDALSALLIEQAGFEAIYMTGNGQAASMLGLPDVGLITLTEMADRVRALRAVTTVPLIADADVGYGSLINVRRAIRELEAAGASAIQLEDQVSPKKCGHELGREIVGIEEMQQRLHAAVEGRQNPDTMIIARTDARTTHGLAEAIRRGHCLCRAGADIIFVESPESEAELQEVARSIPAPTLANMVETGRTPYLSAQRLGELGFAVAIYPARAFLAATYAVRAALQQLKQHGRDRGHVAPGEPRGVPPGARLLALRRSRVKLGEMSRGSTPMPARPLAGYEGPRPRHLHRRAFLRDDARRVRRGGRKGRGSEDRGFPAHAR